MGNASSIYETKTTSIISETSGHRFRDVKHLHTRYHDLRDFIAMKKVPATYMSYHEVTDSAPLFDVSV